MSSRVKFLGGPLQSFRSDHTKGVRRQRTSGIGVRLLWERARLKPHPFTQLMAPCKLYFGEADLFELCDLHHQRSFGVCIAGIISIRTLTV